MDKYDETIKTWNNLAALYEEKFMDLDIYNASYDKFLEAIGTKKNTVLELGCGPGNITKYLLSKNATIEITCTDVSENMIDLAKKNNPGANFKVLDIRHINQINTNFDGIVCGFTLPYLSQEDASILISNCAKLLCTNGIFYLSFVEGDYTKSGFITGSTGDRTYFYYYSADFILAELEKNKLVRIEKMIVPYLKSDGSKENHVIFIAKKSS